MSKLNNLAEFLLGIADKIRTYLPLEGLIDPQNFEEKIEGVFKAGVGNLQVKEIQPAVSEQVINPDAGYRGMSQVRCKKVTSDIDSNITPSNIKEGVTILGVTGTLTESGGEGGEGQGRSEGEVFYLFPFRMELSIE